MRDFDYIASAVGLLTPRTTSLLTAIHEERGRQNARTGIRPDVLTTLTNIARIQSTDASNRIEGIATSDKRLNALVAEKVTPRNRAEEEIAGYRDVLAIVHRFAGLNAGIGFDRAESPADCRGRGLNPISAAAAAGPDNARRNTRHRRSQAPR